MSNMFNSAVLYLFADFGYEGPYVGQLVAAVRSANCGVEIVHLMHDAPSMNPALAAYLLPAITRTVKGPAVFVCVVDPGVGSERLPIIVHSRGRTFVGPDNGLMSRLPEMEAVDRIDWRPESLSSSFHGRDLFAPVGARLAAGEKVQTSPILVSDMVGADWPAESEQVIYVDRYGNAMTGLRAETLAKNKKIKVGTAIVEYADTFSAVPEGSLFWYENSQGLVEIAANGVSASQRLSLAAGARFLVI